MESYTYREKHSFWHLTSLMLLLQLSCETLILETSFSDLWVL
jgi:hypothetical protein